MAKRPENRKHRRFSHGISALVCQDQQIAWELLVEMSTRVSVVGKPTDADCSNFEGEVLVESLNSLFSFFQEVRSLMRRLPVGYVPGGATSKLLLTIDICQGILDTIRPFLEKWQSEFRHYWEIERREHPDKLPHDAQKLFPRYKELVTDWRDVRLDMRKWQSRLSRRFERTDSQGDC